MKQRTGYLLINDPGLPAGRHEVDTITCCHCGTLQDVTGDRAHVASCLRCDDMVCKLCDEVGTCRPFEKWLEQVESGVRRQAAGDALMKALS